MPAEVSVVIPTRNRLHMLRDAVDCALHQQGVNVEVVVVDEGSSDETPQWLASLTDPRVKVVRHDVPVKLPGARNAGVRASTGTYVAFLDDDDLWSRDKLRRQLDAIRQTGAGWAFAGCVHLDGKLRPVVAHRAPSATGIKEALALENAIPAGGSGVLVAREVLDEAGGFDETLVASEDWECWVRLAAVAPAASVDLALVGRRRHTGSMSYDLDRMLDAGRAVGDLHPEMVDGEDAQRPVGKVLYMAGMAREGGDWKSAARIIWLERRRPGTLKAGAKILLTPNFAWPLKFWLRRDRVRWARPLMADIAQYRTGGSTSA